MKKVAFVLCGLLRGWQQTSKTFSYIKEVYPDIEFDFYLSTWEDGTTRLQEQKGCPVPIKQVDLSFFKDLVLDSEEDCYKSMAYPYQVYYKDHHSTINYLNQQPLFEHFYSWQIKRGFELVKESDNYDLVVITRPDVFLHRQFLDKLLNPLDKNSERKYINDFIYSPTSILPYDNRLFIHRDYLFAGNYYTINKFSGMFDDVFVHCKMKLKALHSLQAYYICFRGMQSKDSKGGIDPIRPDSIRKPHQPSEKTLQCMIDEYGVKLYDFHFEQFSNILNNYSVL